MNATSDATVVFVHGACADGSRWAGVIEGLRTAALAPDEGETVENVSCRTGLGRA